MAPTATVSISASAFVEDLPVSLAVALRTQLRKKEAHLKRVESLKTEKYVEYLKREADLEACQKKRHIALRTKEAEYAEEAHHRARLEVSRDFDSQEREILARYSSIRAQNELQSKAHSQLAGAAELHAKALQSYIGSKEVASIGVQASIVSDLSDGESSPNRKVRRTGGSLRASRDGSSAGGPWVLINAGAIIGAG
jgi:hypothetical protein